MRNNQYSNHAEIKPADFADFADLAAENKKRSAIICAICGRKHTQYFNNQIKQKAFNEK